MQLASIIPSALANHFWQSTIFAAVAAALAFALRKNRAQTRYALWLAASLKFLLPFSFLVDIGGHLQWPAAVPVAHPVISAAVQRIGQPFARIEPAFAATSRLAHAPISTSTIILAIWLCGVIAVLVSWFLRWRNIRAAVRRATPLAIEAPIRILSTPSLLEPGLFGILRPILLLPAGIADHLTPAHLEAIIAHELCHARRRDNLAAAVHMFVEAIFWFHPLVWWIGSRLVDERERACDEEVLRLGNQPHIYAESILKTCQFYLGSPLPCLSGVTGADLKKRITQIMSTRSAVSLELRKKLLLAAAGVAVVALPLAAGLANQSRSAGSQPVSFEAASIKPSKPGERGSMIRINPGGRISTTAITPEFLIELAYDVKEAQIAQAPSWLRSDHYDIEAKPEDSAGAALDKLPPEQRQEKLREMVQSLLADRFKLALGHDTKEMTVLTLTVAKSGPKMQKSAFNPADLTPANRPPSPGPGGPSPRGGLMMRGPGNITSTGAEMSMLANSLSMATHQIVVDKTGLAGRYDFTLQWTPDISEGPMIGAGGGAPSAPETPTPESSGLSLFTAIQEQLGLKLESQKAPVDVLVITHVEKPSEN